MPQNDNFPDGSGVTEQNLLDAINKLNEYAGAQDTQEESEPEEPIIVSKLNCIKFNQGDTLVIWIPENYRADYHRHLVDGLRHFRDEMYEIEGIRIHFLMLPNNLGISVLSIEDRKKIIKAGNFNERGRSIELELEEKSE